MVTWDVIPRRLAAAIQCLSQEYNIRYISDICIGGALLEADLGFIQV